MPKLLAWLPISTGNMASRFLHSNDNEVVIRFTKNEDLFTTSGYSLLNKCM